MARTANRAPQQTTLIDASNASNFSEVTGAGVTRVTDTSVTYNGASTTRVFVPAALATQFEVGVTGATVTFPYLSATTPPGGSIGVIYRTDTPSRITSVNFYVGDAGYANFGVNANPVSSNDTGWRLATSANGTWGATGSPTYSGLRRTKIRFMVTAGADANVWVAGYVVFGRSRATFVLTCDDGYDEFYTYLYPACVSRGIPVSMSISSALVGTAGFVTAAQCREMQGDASGLVELTNHSKENNSYSTLGLSAYMSDVEECRRFLQGVGATDSASCHAYVQGAFDSNLQSALAASGFSCAREVGASDRSANRQDLYFNPLNRYALPASCNLENTQPLATVQGYIDNAIRAGGLFVAMGHRFEAAAGTITYATSDMDALLNFVALRRSQGLLDVIKMSEIPSRFINADRARVP